MTLSPEAELTKSAPKKALRSDSADIELLRMANDTALKWFEVHADQRMAMFRFFWIAVGVVGLGFGTALQNNLPLLASVMGVLLACFAICFKQLDRRTSQLVKQAESAMQITGHYMVVSLGDDCLNVAKEAEKKNGVPSYRETFGLVYRFVGVLGALLAVLPWTTK